MNRCIFVVTLLGLLASSGVVHASETSFSEVGAPNAPAPSPQVGPAKMPYRKDAPPPPGYHLERRVRPELVLAGASTFGITYGLAVYAGATSADMNWLFVPVIGPLVAAGRPKPSGEDCCTSHDFVPVWLAIDGVAQAAGLALTTVGLLAGKSWWVRDTREAARYDQVTWSIAPRATATGGEFRIAGTF